MIHPLAEAPESIHRLFVDYDGDDLDAAPRPFLIGRLLEEGEGKDLEWLTSRVSEGDLVSWTAGPGQRQLCLPHELCTCRGTHRE